MNLFRQQACVWGAMMRTTTATRTGYESWFSTTSAAGAAGEQSKEEILKSIDAAVKADPCVVYMKGTPDSPRCGFSGMVVRILNHEGARFTAYDVLADDNLRTFVKEYSNWPTFPQVYIAGEFVGGCDIVTEMHKAHELQPLLQNAGALKK